ncbi:MAG: 1-acyl-sn-glycerol-3-phosphate acyltransferase [Gemmatimonadaceae bacterium]|nr:1-acyl-sn-glycerol-3-phosphate acyltransferase [Gemmatimonadaceae bacterium]
MWLYRAMPLISELAVRSYYRVSVSGARLPATGPVLLVANHNNSLVDPALVASMAGRNVRFLAKSPLFTHPLIGWLIKGVGSVPVYRQQDDPTRLAQNLDTFRDVHRVLAAGDVVGIFPEGTSHSASRLAPLKTGAARIAIGAAAQLGRDFPIVAMGLVFRDRDTFRSEAHVIIAESFSWNDLVGDVNNRVAVRELTQRIERAMRTVSLNLEAWEDEPLVRTAEGVWRAEFSRGETVDAADEVARLRVTSEALAALRDGGADAWKPTADALREHGRALRRYGLTPQTLVEEISAGQALRWAALRVLLLPLIAVSVAGAIWFWLAKRVTVMGAAYTARIEGEDTIVTHRVLVGAVIFPLWIVATSLVLGAFYGWLAGLASMLLQPAWAAAALVIGERRQAMFTAVRRYLLRRFIGKRLRALREAQREIASQLQVLLAAVGPPAAR